MRATMAERGKLTGGLAEKMAGIDGAVTRRLLRLIFWQGDVPVRFGRGGSSAVAVRARGGEEARVRRRKKAPPLPYL